jgi:hypothetical protein
MQVTREMFLNTEEQPCIGLLGLGALSRKLHVSRWLGSRSEVALLFVFFENHYLYRLIDDRSIGDRICSLDRICFYRLVDPSADHRSADRSIT